MFYQPPRALGLLVGSLLTFWALGIAAVLAIYASGRDFDLITAVTYTMIGGAFVLAAMFGYWTASLATLSYAVDRNGLVIHWGATRQIIPLGAIERLVPGTAVGVPRVRGVTWLGCHVGTASIQRIGEVLFYSTHQTPEQVLYVMTTERNYAISVPDPADFAREIQLRQDLGPTARVAHHVERSAPGLQGFLHDRRGLTLAAIAGLLGVAVWVVIGWLYGGLPETFEMRFPPSSSSPLLDLARRADLLEIARAATVVLIFNVVAGALLYAWNRWAAYVLFVSAATLQAGFLVAFLLVARDL
ncbi:MAG: PH domain-containing protein [Chloroflexi bacterium]|nr:PH domain-containing protein [Chloroflexota bacterium]